MPNPRFVPQAVCIASPSGAGQQPGSCLAVVSHDGAGFEIAVVERTEEGLRLVGPSGGLDVDETRPEDVTARALGHELLATVAESGLPAGRLRGVVLDARASASPQLLHVLRQLTGLPVQFAPDLPGGLAGAAFAAVDPGRQAGGGNVAASGGEPTPRGRRTVLIAGAMAAALVLGGLGVYLATAPASTPASAGTRPTGTSQAGPTTLSSALPTVAGTAPGPYDVYVADQETNTLTPVNTTAGAAGPPIQLGACRAPGDLVISRDRKQGFVNCVGPTILAVNLTTGRVGPAISLTMPGNNDMVFSPDGSTLYVFSRDQSVGAGAVTPIDTRTDALGKTIPVSDNVNAMAVTPDGRHVYALDYGTGGGQLGSFIDIDTTRATASAPIQVGENPTAIVFTPDGRTAFIACSSSGFVLPVDTATDTVGQPIQVDGNPLRLAITPDGRTVYALGANAQTSSGSAVTPIDVASDAARTPIDIKGDQMAIAPGGGQVFTYGSASQQSVNWFDTATGSVGQPIQVGTYPAGIAFSASGKTAFVLRDGTGTVDPVTTVVPVDLPSGRPGKPIVLPGPGVLAVPAPVVHPRPAPSGPSHSPAGTPSASGGPQDGGAGARCGTVGPSPTNGTLVLVIQSGTVTCSEALKVLADYRADTNRQGSGGFATVDGWNCSHNSVAGFEQSGALEGCQRGSDSFGTQAG
ncbi:YncE family protein [Streptacidiphilus carbonis]|uniref:YncE family protein n=1 Tax=Streptacidiphilus carbonis TaxID=105422 RepID=UPI001269EE20|nr:YncE family protein [Streptacidiphilus carbonis]